MKTLALSLLLSLTVAAPALAEPVKPAPAPAVAPAQPEADNAAAVIDETAIANATTPEARRALLTRCSGPPPRPAHVAKVEPKAEPEAPN